MKECKRMTSYLSYLNNAWLVTNQRLCKVRLSCRHARSQIPLERVYHGLLQTISTCRDGLNPRDQERLRPLTTTLRAFYFSQGGGKFYDFFGGGSHRSTRTWSKVFCKAKNARNSLSAGAPPRPIGRSYDGFLIWRERGSSRRSGRGGKHMKGKCGGGLA